MNSSPKVLAMYLPQFHRTPENDAWWGEGFTEWTAVKGAKPCFDGHIQPKIPKNENYYNLLEKSVMEWQADLMHQYGVDGMCIYHYWFKNGRKILEKPAENLLKWQGIDMPYCFCWANEAWARSWSKLEEKNVWANTFENNADRQGNGVLLEQDYGDDEIWKQHFYYLLPFFRDKRYIKIDGRPVFVIYRMSEVSCIEEMATMWRKLAIEEGLGGIYLIGSNCNRDYTGVLDGQLFHEPQMSIKEYNALSPKTSGDIRRLSYEDLWNNIIAMQREYRLKTYFGGFVSYDDTPRRGKEGTISCGEPTLFCDYLKKLIAKNARFDSELVFVNAWNEWGEGMYLEPDEEHGYQYLESVLEAKQDWKKYLDYDFKHVDIKADKIKEYSNRINTNLLILDKWMTLIEKGISVADYVSCNYKGNVAIYGYGVLGRHLYSQLVAGKVHIHGVIDMNPSKIHIPEKVFSPEEDFPIPDVIIVTAQHYYSDVEKRMRDKGIKTIISIDELLRKCREQSSPK